MRCYVQRLKARRRQLLYPASVRLVMDSVHQFSNRSRCLARKGNKLCSEALRTEELRKCRGHGGLPRAIRSLKYKQASRINHIRSEPDNSITQRIACRNCFHLISHKQPNCCRRVSRRSAILATSDLVTSPSWGFPTKHVKATNRTPSWCAMKCPSWQSPR